jgi:hypothetical protein
MDDLQAMAMLRSNESEVNAFRVDEWRRLIQYLLDRLQEYFGGRVVAEPFRDACVGDGFCINVSSDNETPDAPISWKGIFGDTIIDGKLYVSLTVFFYSGAKRLFANDGNEFAEYDLDISGSDMCRWKLFGWFKDEFGEYDGFL